MQRITYGMSVQRTLLDQRRNLYNLDSILQAMSSGTPYHKPSDSPIKVSRIMRLQTELRVNEVYSESIADAQSWTSKTDDSLQNIKKIIDRVKELVTEAANGTLGPEDKQQIEAELRELKNSAINIGNDDYMGRHQFSGHKTDLKFVNEDGSYNTNLDLAGLSYEEINYIIGVSQKSKINFSGIEVFGHEYYHTNTRADNHIPFSENDSKTILGGKMNITIQKYKQLYNDLPKEQRPEEYEKDQILEDILGDPIELKNITFYNNYDKDDINSVVEEMNNSLRDKIKLYVEDKISATGPGTPPTPTPEEVKKRKELETELKNAVQFVNDNGKIALVTDNDYGVEKIGVEPLKFEELKANGETDAAPMENKKIQVGDLNNTTIQAGITKGYLSVLTSFDISEFITYKKNENGDLVDASGNLRNGGAGVEDIPHDKIGDIVFAKTYSLSPSSDKGQVAHQVARDLQVEINKKIAKYNETSPNKIDPNSIKVVVDEKNNNQISIVVDKYDGIEIKSPTNNYKEVTLTPGGETSDTKVEDKTQNEVKSITLDLNGYDATKPNISNVGFTIDVTKHKSKGEIIGDKLFIGPVAGTPGGGGSKYELDIASGYKSQIKVELINKYEGTEKQVQAQMAQDIKDQIINQLSEINKKIEENNATLDPDKRNKGYDYNDVEVFVKDGKINVRIADDITYEFKNDPPGLTNTILTPTDLKDVTAETKKPLDIPIEINTDPKGDTHVYMDLNLNLTEYNQDVFGDEQTSDIKRTINLDEITLNKKYSYMDYRMNPDGTVKTDAEVQEAIKDAIFEDVKKAIEEKVNAINPPLQKNAVSIVRDGENIRLLMTPDISTELSYDEIDSLDGNPHLTKTPDYTPKTDEKKQPEREMMPFFEMMDRIMYMCHNGDSKGLSRMEKVVDWHAGNNVKVQGQGGGRSKMYKIMTERTKDLELNYKDLLSDTRDTDYAEAIANLALLKYVYSASLAVTAKIIQPSLVDFLR